MLSSSTDVLTHAHAHTQLLTGIKKKSLKIDRAATAKTRVKTTTATTTTAAAASAVAAAAATTTIAAAATTITTTATNHHNNKPHCVQYIVITNPIVFNIS